jgi:hypothetical protein
MGDNTKLIKTKLEGQITFYYLLIIANASADNLI